MYEPPKNKSDYFAIQSPTEWFLYTRPSVYCAVRTESLNTVRLILVFKWLKRNYKHRGIAINNGSHMQAETEWIQTELLTQARS